MAKRTTIESDRQPTGKEIRTPAEQTIKNFNSTFDSVKETVDEANKDLQESAKDAKSKHLVIPAFKAAKQLSDAFHNAKNPSIASEKLAAWLANFDKLREYFKLDEHANLQGRMVAAGSIGSGKPADVNGVPRQVDEDGELDPRPTHLRREGASAAEQKPNPVRDLAEKTGATVNPIDQVGRGKTH